MREVHLHLISDSTGETLLSVSRACIAQFEGVDVHPHQEILIRTKSQMDRVIGQIVKAPGPVICTIVNHGLYSQLELACHKMNLPCVPLLDRALVMLSAFLGQSPKGKPGGQHVINHNYFERIDAMDYAMRHDDGQLLSRLSEADVVLIGVSRTSKTPTCVYLANRGIKAANYPLVPGQIFPTELLQLTKPAFIGLISDPRNLVDLRRNRLHHLGQNEMSDYVEMSKVQEEVRAARRLYTQNRWPIIDVTRRSIEETAAQVIKHLNSHRETLGIMQVIENF